jgi:hypothetical protein
VRAVPAHREAVGERQPVDQHLHLPALRVVPQQPPRGVAGDDDAQELPPLEPRARLGEVDGARVWVELVMPARISVWFHSEDHSAYQYGENQNSYFR